MPFLSTVRASLPRLLHLVRLKPRKPQLRDFIRNGNVVPHCKLVERFIIDQDANRSQLLPAFDTSIGVATDVLVPGRSVYAHIHRQLKTTPIWKISRFIDTETKEHKRALHLEDIKEHKERAHHLLGKGGIIILINGEEPGNGTTPLHNFFVQKGDVVEIVYKSDRIIRYK
ncbi:hypothetical protein HY492_03385 [Candidatus Woesearchaeota archaeon]|nr:hypothetical protein [Candidatus Woesearchaeota archaeon]